MNNDQGISKIEFNRTVFPYCPLGRDNYRATVNVTVFPDKELFDFIEVDEKIKALTNQVLLIEDVAERVYEIVKKYNPTELTVKVEAESNTHFPVTVWKY